MVGLDRREQRLLRVVDAGNELAVALRVGGPEDDDLVESVGGLEVADVLADLLEVRLLGRSWQNIVGTLLLAASARCGSARVRRQRGRHWRTWR